SLACISSQPRFIFQAEDGIRDYKVTGVQTCALPISEGRGFLLVPRLSGNTFGGGAHRSIPTQAHKAHAQVWHGESPTGDALRLRARFAKFCADFESELVQMTAKIITSICESTTLRRSLSPAW